MKEDVLIGLWLYLPVACGKEQKTNMSKTISTVHEEAVRNFISLKLSYRFSATIHSTVAAEHTACLYPCTIRFLFSKPTPQAPEPAITVFVDLQVVSEEGSNVTYALFFEGQQYKRLITINSANVTGAEFNERLLDKVFAQKDVVRRRRLWDATTLDV